MCVVFAVEVVVKHLLNDEFYSKGENYRFFDPHNSKCKATSNRFAFFSMAIRRAWIWFFVVFFLFVFLVRWFGVCETPAPAVSQPRINFLRFANENAASCNTSSSTRCHEFEAVASGSLCRNVASSFVIHSKAYQGCHRSPPGNQESLG
jgi:hypothetical protein